VYNFHNLPLIATIIAGDDVEAALAEPASPAAMKISYTIDIYILHSNEEADKELR